MQPETILAFEALDRLNSFVRSEAHRREFYMASPRRAVYEMKRQAILVAHAAGIAEHRRVAITAKCRDCGGSGRYVDSYGERFPWCRACSSSGTVTLRFVETAIALPERALRWHSPRTEFSLWPVEPQEPAHLKWHDERGEWFPAESPTGWTVNEMGRDLEIWEVARDLVTAEAAFKATRYRRRDWGYSDGGCSLDPFLYALCIGETERVCWKCAAPVPDERGWVGGHVGRVRFTAACCDLCEKRMGRPWPTELPRALVGHKSVREWIALHPPAPPEARG